MGARHKRRWPGWTSGLVWGLLAALVWLNPLAGLGPLLVVPWLLLLMRANDEPLVVSAAPTGLRLFTGEGVRRLPWSHVHQVTRDPSGWRIDTSVGTLVLCGPRPGWQRLGARIETLWAAATSGATVGNDVSPEQLREWLGIGVGQTLEGSRAGDWPFLLVARLLVAGGLIGLLAGGYPAWFGVACLLLLVLMHRLDRRIAVPRAGFSANEHGLTVSSAMGRRQTVGWDALQGMIRGSRRARLITVTGALDLPLPLPNAERFLDTVAQVLATPASVALPRLAGDASEAALSRVRMEPVDERAISLAASRETDG